MIGRMLSTVVYGDVAARGMRLSTQTNSLMATLGSVGAARYIRKSRDRGKDEYSYGA